MSKHSIS